MVLQREIENAQQLMFHKGTKSDDFLFLNHGI